MSWIGNFIQNAADVLAAAARWTGHLATLAILAVLALAGGFLVFADLATSGDRADPGRADGIVVLTGGEERVAAAIDLLMHDHGARLLISGVNPSTTRDQLARLYPKAVAQFRCCIDLDWNAVDTISNAEETAAWARRRGFKSLIVVTSGYHMPRSIIELKRELPEARLIPYPVKAFEMDSLWTHPAELRLLLWEYFKLFPAMARFAAARIAGGGQQTAARP